MQPTNNQQEEKMKARVLTVIVLLALSAAAVAQVQTYPWYNSFRNQSTSGLLEDDLDLMLGSYGYLDPARMTLIDGRRLYTNLANIYTQNEEQFNPSDAGTYVIGGNSDIMGYGKLGLLYSQNTYKDIDSMAYANVNLLDIDPGTNPGYDIRSVENYHEQDVVHYGEKDYFLGWAKQVNDMRLGVAFKGYQYSYMEDWYSNYEYYDQNMITGVTTYSEAEKDTGSWGGEESENIIGFSVWKPLNDKMDVSLRLALGFGGFKAIDEYDYSWNDAYTGGASYNQTENWNNDTEFSGIILSGGGAYVYKWNDKADTRFDLQYTRMSYKPKSGTTWEYNYAEQYYIPTPAPGTGSDYYTNSYTEGVEGEYGDNDIDFRIVHKAKLNKATFAIGFGLGTGNYEQTETHDRAETDVETYNELNDPSLPNSYVETSTWGETWDYMETGEYLAWTFPVCVEFDLTKSIVFRLGARHQIYSYEYTYTEALTGGTDMVTVTTRYGDGTTTVGYNPNPLNEQTGYAEAWGFRQSYTDYTYGAGWKVTDNLQLDFMGFAKLTDLTNWKLSAVFKF
jgi:hypothetical protein